MIVGVVGYFSDPGLSASWYPDTGGYVAVAKNLSAPNARERPPGYPALLWLSMKIGGSNWTHCVILLQIAMIAVIASLTLHQFRAAGLSTSISLLLACLVGISPGFLSSARQLLSELLLALILAAVWVSFTRLLDSDTPGAPRRDVPRAIYTGLLSGLAVLIKPAWLLGFLPLVLGVLITSRKNLHRALLLSSVITGAHVLVWLPWQVHLFREFDQTSVSRTGVVNLNLWALRAGLAKYGAGTPLYEFLEKEDLLSAAIALNWNDVGAFNALKDRIPWEVRCDSSFFRTAVHGHRWEFIRSGLKRFPRVFVARMPPLPVESFRDVPAGIRYLYDGGFAWLYRPIGPFTIALSVFLAIRYRRARPTITSAVLILGYMGTILALVTYLDSHFMRMRVGVEPMLLFLILLPVGFILERLRPSGGGHRQTEA